MNNCFNCGSAEHKNYQCPLPKSSGSAEIKKNLRKQFRQQNPQQQLKNMSKYMEKKENLSSVLSESGAFPMPVIIKYSELNFSIS